MVLCIMGCKLGHKVPNIYSYVWKGRQLLFIVNSAKIAFYNFIFTIIKICLRPSIIRTQDLKSFGNSFSRFAARGIMVQHILIYIHTTRKVVNTVQLFRLEMRGVRPLDKQQFPVCGCSSIVSILTRKPPKNSRKGRLSC